MRIGSEAAMAVALFASVASLAWSAAFAWARWLARPREPQPPATLPARPDLAAQVEQRLARLELAVDAIAVEVERLAEGQRYAARLLEDRLPASRPALPRPERPGSREESRTTTPH